MLKLTIVLLTCLFVTQASLSEESSSQKNKPLCLDDTQMIQLQNEVNMLMQEAYKKGFQDGQKYERGTV